MLKTEQRKNQWFNIISLVFKVSPFGAIFTILYYLFNGLFPAFFLFSTTELFNEIEKIILIGSGSYEIVWLYCFILISLFLFKTILSIISSVAINACVFEKTATFCKTKFSTCAYRMPYRNFENYEILNNMESAKKCIDYYAIPAAFISLVNFCSIVVGVFAMTVALWRYSYWLVIFCFFMVLFQFIMQTVLKKKNYVFNKHNLHVERKNNYILSLFSNYKFVREIRVYDNFDFFMKKWEDNNLEYTSELNKKNRLDNILRLIVGLYRNFSLICCILIVFYMTVNNMISVSVLGTTFFAFYSLQSMLESLVENIAGYYEKLLMINDFFVFCDLKVGAVGCENIGDEISKIEFKDVSFRYAGREDLVLNNVNCIINKNEKIAIVGQNGEGKTTFIKLLLKAYSPTSGNILINNKSIETIEDCKIYEKISYLNQEYGKYNFTVKENILLSYTSNVGFLDLDFCVKFLEIEDLVSKCDENEIIGKPLGNLDLSEGEWQKIAIARCVIRNCDVIIMDEPTSNLDPISEVKYFNKLISFCEGKTLIVITHRMGICPYMDKVFFFSDGKIEGQSKHDTLLNENEKYRRMYNEQATWYN